MELETRLCTVCGQQKPNEKFKKRRPTCEDCNYGNGLSVNRNSKEFQKLQAEWDRKLKKAGFNDIEQRDGNLKNWDSHFFNCRYHPTQFEAREAYFQKAGQFLNEYKFTERIDRIVWELHASGLSFREIARELKRRRIKAEKDKVRCIVQRLLEEMMKGSDGKN